MNHLDFADADAYIERPKGYVNIDEVYEALNNVEKEVDYEYGDFGEVLSKWVTCDYGEVLDSISCCDVVKAIPLDKVKQTMADLAKKVIKYSGSGNDVTQAYCDGLKYNLAILNELIDEVD